MIPVMKISNNPVKSSLPGIKQVYRLSDSSGSYLRDLITLAGEEPPRGEAFDCYHPMMDSKSYRLEAYGSCEPLLIKVMEKGVRTMKAESLIDMQSRCREQKGLLDETYKRILNPHDYKISLSGSLKELKSRLLRQANP